MSGRKNGLLGVDLGGAALRKRGGGGCRVVWTGDKAEKGRVVVGSLWSRVRGRIVGMDETTMTRGDGWMLY